MTKQGEQWVAKLKHSHPFGGADYWSPEEVLKAFCDEVHERAIKIREDGYSTTESVYRAFAYIKLELLG